MPALTQVSAILSANQLAMLKLNNASAIATGQFNRLLREAAKKSYHQL